MSPVLLLLATLVGCDRSCGTYESNNPEFGSSLESFEKCGELGSWLFDYGTEPPLGTLPIWANLSPWDTGGLSLFVDVWFGDITVGSTYAVDDGTIAGEAYWIDADGSQRDYALLTEGSLAIEDELKPNKYTDEARFQATWNLTWGDPSSDAAWYTFDAEDMLQVTTF